MVPPRCTSARFGMLMSYHMEPDYKICMSYVGAQLTLIILLRFFAV